MLNLWICDNEDSGGAVQPNQTHHQDLGYTEPESAAWGNHTADAPLIVPMQIEPSSVSPAIDHGHGRIHHRADPRTQLRTEAQLVQVPVVSIGGSVVDMRGSTVVSNMGNENCDSADKASSGRRRTFYKRTANVKVFGADESNNMPTTSATPAVAVKEEQPVSTGFPCPSTQVPVSEPTGPTPNSVSSPCNSEEIAHFHEMYSKLCIFKNTFGHTNVLKNSSWFLLGSWVQRVRKQKKIQGLRERGIMSATDLPSLSPLQVQMLDAVGFSWQEPSARESEIILKAIQSSKVTEGTLVGQTQSSQAIEPERKVHAHEHGSHSYHDSFLIEDDVDCHDVDADIDTDVDDDDDDHHRHHTDHEGNMTSMAICNPSMYDGEHHHHQNNMFPPNPRWDYSQSQQGYNNSQSFGSEAAPDHTSSLSSSRSETQCNHSVDADQSHYMSAYDSNMGAPFSTHSNHFQPSVTTSSMHSNIGVNPHNFMPNNQGFPMGMCSVYSHPQSMYGSQSQMSSSPFAPSEVLSSHYSANGSQCGNNTNTVMSNHMTFAPSEVYSSSHHSVYSHGSSPRPQSVYSHGGHSTKSVDCKSSVSSRSGTGSRQGSEGYSIGMKRKSPPSSTRSNSSDNFSQHNCVAEKNWNLKYASLMKFKAKHGHCDVPARYDEDPKLGHWVMTQRRQYHLMQKGKATRMTLSRIKRLEQAGLQWSVRMNPTNLWNRRLQELTAFKEKYGTCLVPQRFESNPQLGTWYVSHC
jgi:hypothetical protein